VKTLVAGICCCKLSEATLLDTSAIVLSPLLYDVENTVKNLGGRCCKLTLTKVPRLSDVYGCFCLLKEEPSCLLNWQVVSFASFTDHL
jgi:hypothetical protein